MQPLISVCIPVYDTEPYLEQCLRSVISQDFDAFEIVVVSDDSRGRNGRGWSAKKIVRCMQIEGRKLRKEMGLPSVPLRFIEHSENRGLVEVRRTLVYEARGQYILQCDSDDQLESGALKALWAAVSVPEQSRRAGTTCASEGVDIIHGTSTAGSFDDENQFTPAKQNRYGKIYYGTMEGHEIFHRWLIDAAFTSNSWGKLIRKEIFVQAFENIPYTMCNMAEDVLIFFFISQYAKSYIGIEEKVCRYRIDSGMSSARKIDSVRKWRMVCSAASVFSILSEWIKEHPSDFSEDEVLEIKKKTAFYLSNNIKQLKETVVPELQDLALEILKEYWGPSFVEKISQVTMVE